MKKELRFTSKRIDTCFADFRSTSGSYYEIPVNSGFYTMQDFIRKKEYAQGGLCSQHLIFQFFSFLSRHACAYFNVSAAG